MAKRMPSAAEAAAKWKRSMAGAGQAYTEGIDRVEDSPMEAAEAAADRMIQGVTEAVADGRYAAGLRRVSLAEWKDRAKKLGAPRLAQGAAESETRTRQAMEQNFADIASVLATLPPRGTIEQNLERARQFALGMRERRSARA